MLDPTPAPGSSICSNCQHGLSIQCRLAHPEVHHTENIPAPQVKQRWEHEDLVMLAHPGHDLQTQRVRNINHRLAASFPQRSLESIKGCRNTNPVYKTVLKSLRVPTGPASDPVPPEPGPTPAPMFDPISDSPPDLGCFTVGRDRWSSFCGSRPLSHPIGIPNTQYQGHDWYQVLVLAPNAGQTDKGRLHPDALPYQAPSQA